MEKLYTKQEIADQLRVSTKTIERLIISLEIPVLYVGRQLRIPESSRILFLNRNVMTQRERQDVINKIYGG